MAHGGVPHGPSHVAAVRAQSAKAMARGARTSNMATTTTAIAPRGLIDLGLNPTDVQNPVADSAPPARHACGYGVGVGVPGYFASIARLTSRSGLPCPRIAITSRVTSRQIAHVAAWLVNVSVPSR